MMRLFRMAPVVPPNPIPADEVTQEMKDAVAEQKIAEDASKEEERRQFCICHAVALVGVDGSEVIRVAEKIYDYVYGKKG